MMKVIVKSPVVLLACIALIALMFGSGRPATIAIAPIAKGNMAKNFLRSMIDHPSCTVKNA